MWEWFIHSLDRYNDFEGRASRTEFWSFAAAQLIITIGLLCVSGLLNMFTGVFFFSPLLVGFSWLVLMVPGLAVSVRRLHDINKSGWFLLLPIIPFGGILLLLFLAREGSYGENDYGPDPFEYLDLDELEEAQLWNEEPEMTFEEWTRDSRHSY